MNQQLYISARAAGRICTLCLFIWLSCPAFVQATTYYVKPGGSDSNTGLSWAQAYLTLQKAIETAVAGDEIWVAAGTYYPTKDINGNASPGDSRTKTFFINKDIKIYGGFAGTETMLSQRDWVMNVTTLSGDIGTPGDNSDNCYHVVFMQHLSNMAVLDGFSITAGNANNGVDFPNNRGGGIYNNGSGSGNSSTPSIANCSFSGNSAAYSGGAVFNDGTAGNSSPSFTNCSFSGNSALLGGAVYNDDTAGNSSPSFTNCSFSGNSAVFVGGAVFNYGSAGNSSLTFTNCSFSGNSAFFGGGAVYNDGSSGSSPTFTNCILWGNSSEILNISATSTISYSIVQGGISPCTNCPGGNGNVDPLFVSQPLFSSAPTTSGDLHLQAGSPAIEAGTSMGAPATDLDGNPRPSICAFDIGAYEFQGSIPLPTASCKNATIAVDAMGDATLTAGDVDNGSMAPCGLQGLSVAPSAFNCSHVGTPQNVTLTVTDVNNNTATCSATVTVQDNTPPTAVCLNPTIGLDANGQASITTADVFDAANSSDNCGNPYPVFVTPNTFDCSNIGANTVTLQIIDLHGNTALCNATVTLVDNIAPTVTCKNTSVTLNSQGQASIQPIEVYDSGNDNCGNVNLQSVSPNSFDCSNVGANTVTLTVNDGHGNTATCSASVSVNDNKAPTAKCKNHSVALDANGQATITAADVNDGSSDKCGIGNMSVSPSSFGCANTGPNTVTLTVSDAQGNTATCSASVTVQDNTPPTALCQNFTTDLDPDGTYTLAPSSIDNGSSDNCSVSLSVSPNQFDCGDIGANTVTLTATDPSGNTATCTATLTINPFVVIHSVSSTAETCQGSGDGTITINATTLGGTLIYSINGGGSYQGSNTFTSVSPGSYSIVVLAQGTSGCSASANASVGSGPAPTTWYKDLDGDGYTDGIAHVSCSPPAGYVASAIPGDCNDNDATVNPGAPELCNGLDDNCDGIIPANEQDNDGDGYRLCDGDCDDNNAAINPGAAEVCNGIDDNCNGQIDEGNPPANRVHVGNVILTSQAAVNNFSQCIYKIQGSLTIQGTGINSLANLSNLQEVTGNITIQITSLSNMNGLDALTTIGGSLTIKLNNYGAKLTSLSGLGNLTSIGQNLNISFNFSLSDCCSIDDLLANAGVGGSISIHHNASGCNSVSDISNSCGNNSIIIPGGGIAFGQQAEDMKMSLYPNPATTEVTVLLEGLGEQTGTLVISDLLGRTILQQRLEPGQMLVNLDLAKHDLGTGIYQVLLRTDTEQLVQRLVIER
ncbi:MAG: hypothetical protein Kow0027_17640 [Saprospiraceae bacterium]